MTERRNVLFVVIDQFRADLLHGALAAHVELPNLRSLMAESVSFANHYSVTSPCGPARASLLTGQYAMNHRAVRNGTPLPHDTPNLAGEARKAGYLPLLYGYTDVAADPRRYDAADPMVRTYEQVMPGFHEVIEMRMQECLPWRAHLLAKGYDVPPFPMIYRPAGPAPDDPAFYAAEDSDTAFLADRVIGDLRARPQGWFAHVAFLRPHPPFVAPAPYNRMYDPASLPPPVPGTGDHPFDAPARKAAAEIGLTIGIRRPTTPETVQVLRALYLGLASEVDHHLGRILSFLKDEGQYDNTLIVVTTDHGEMLGDRELWGKASYYDACFHVPLIVRDPMRWGTAGQVVTAITESVDVAPTILDLIGRAAPDTMDGQSLRRFLDGDPPDGWRQASLSELDFGNPLAATHWQRALGLGPDLANLAILRGEHATLVHFNGDLPPILFDKAGAGEDRNIAAEPDSQELLLQMTQGLLSRRMTHSGGPFGRTMITPEGPKRA